MNKPQIIIIVGATASGKTGLSIDIAKKYNGEVISADSRQVYRKLDIGTAKVTREEMDGIPHHLIDASDIDNTYTASDFATDASRAIEDIVSRNKTPIIAGGTFFYIDALLNKSTLAKVKPNPELREQLEKLPTVELVKRLNESDPDRASNIDTNNRRRLIRSLEIIAELGKVPTTQNIDCPYEVLWIGIHRDKEELRDRYKQRCELWLKGGLLDEVNSLLENGVSRERLQEIGFEYSLTLDLIDGNIDEGEYKQKFIEKNWQYAKRQLTWLKRNSEIHWIEPKNSEAVFRFVEKFLQTQT